MPQIAVPVVVLQHMALVGMATDATSKEQVVRYLGLIAFFYLLCVGEYTHKIKCPSTCTIQFRFRDFAFKKGNTILLCDASEAEPMEATGTTLRMTTRKTVCMVL